MNCHMVDGADQLADGVASPASSPDDKDVNVKLEGSQVELDAVTLKSRKVVCQSKSECRVLVKQLLQRNALR